MSAKPTLMLLDGNSLAYRAFYALPAENFKTKSGLTTNAVYGFTAMLINLMRDEAPTHIAAAFDVSRQTFRSERFPEYKATRSATPDEFRGQIDHFPTWRTSRSEIWDIGKRFQWCNVSIRANELQPDAAEYGDLELALSALNNGMKISVPGIRH